MPGPPPGCLAAFWAGHPAARIARVSLTFLPVLSIQPGKLELAEADLLTPGAFDAAFSGCRYVFHTASPFFIEAGDPQAQLVEPAVQGTRNVMEAAARNKATVRRVVLTSSCAGKRGSWQRQRQRQQLRHVSAMPRPAP